MNLELHKRITREQDLFFANKASRTRHNKYQKKFEKRQKQKEKEKRIKEKVKNGMTEMQAMLDDDYRKNIGKKNHLLDRINRCNFTGASISFPLINNRSK